MSALSPTAYQREAERLKVMARRANAEGDVQWAKRWLHMARNMQLRATEH